MIGALGLLGAALAGSAVSEMRAALEGPTPVVQGITCTPMGAALERLASLPWNPETLRSLSPGLDRRMESLQPAKAAAAGLDLSGTMAYFEVKGEARQVLPFRGDLAQAEAFFAQGGATVVREGDRLLVTPTAGARATAWQLEGGALVHREPHTSAAGSPPQAALLDGLPTGPGCIVYTRDTAKAQGKFSATAVFVPLDGQSPLRWRVATPAPPPKAFAAPTGPWVGAATRTPPMVVGGLGVSGDALLELMANTPGAPLADIQRFREVISLPAGVTFAIFAVQPGPRFAMVVPVHDADGDPLSARRLRRLVSGISDNLRRTDTLRFEGSLPTKKGPVPLALGLREGAVIIASDAALVDEVLAGQGADWVSPQVAELSQDWPLAVATAGGTPFAVQAGLRAQNGLWELHMDVDLPPAAPGGPSLMGLIVTNALDKVVEVRDRMESAELLETADGLRGALRAHEAKGGPPLVLPPAPRATPDAQRVPATFDGAWATLDWRPGAEPLRGVYWVEQGPEGFVVRGRADINGDGVFVEVKATAASPAVFVRP